jgi:nucleotide-binding universal stress UspA family protein
VAYGKILVPVSGDKDDASALAAAFAAARPFNAHVIALFCFPDPREVVASIYAGAPMSPDIVQSIVDGQVKLAKDAESRVRASLTAAARDAHAEVLEKAAPRKSLSCSLHVRYGFMPHVVAEEARFADVVVFKPASGDTRPEITGAVLDTLTRACRPVILSTQDPIETLGSKIAVAWDGQDAAAHAATAALPFLKRAVSVEILIIEPIAGRKVTGAEQFSNYLSFHGVAARVREVRREHDRTVAECLMSEAVKSGADLLVMGGYGHSHVREIFVGGVTLETVSHHALPVFLMH